MPDPTLLKKVYAHPLFTPEQMNEVCRYHQQISIAKGDYFIQVNKYSNHFYILEEGMARAYVFDFRGNDITTQFFIRVNIIIEPYALFHRMHAIENMVALSDCIAWKIHFDHFQEAFHTMPAMAEWGRLWMSENLTQLKLRSIEMITQDATTRYMRLLETKPEIIQKAPLKHIATYLGITDTSLSRIRARIS